MICTFVHFTVIRSHVCEKQTNYIYGIAAAVFFFNCTKIAITKFKYLHKIVPILVVTLFHFNMVKGEVVIKKENGFAC